MAKWQASKSDMSPRKGYIPEIQNDDQEYYYRDEEDEATLCLNCANSRDAQYGKGTTTVKKKDWDDYSDLHCQDCESCIDHPSEKCPVASLGLGWENELKQDGTQSDNAAAAQAVAKTETPRGQRSPLNIPMNWED
jgi:hypothetical protein